MPTSRRIPIYWSPPKCAQTIIPDVPLIGRTTQQYGRYYDTDGRKFTRFELNAQVYGGIRNPGANTPRPPQADPYHVMSAPRKLDTAIKSDITDHFREYYSTLQLHDSDPSTKVNVDWNALTLINQYDFPNPDATPTDTTFLPRLISSIHLKAKTSMPDAAISTLVRRALRVTQAGMDIQIAYNFESLSPGIREPLRIPRREYLNRLNSLPYEVLAHIEAYTTLSHLLDRIPFGTIGSGCRSMIAKAVRYQSIMVHHSNRFTDPDGLGLTAVWSVDTCYLSVDGDWWILPTSCLYEIHNKVADHLSVLLFSHFSEGSYLENGAYSATVSFLNNLHQAHCERPESFFSVASAIEAVGIGILIERHDSFENDEFLEATLRDINLESTSLGELGFGYSHPLVRIMRSSSSPLLAELACLSKMSGHPITSTREGMEKLYKRTTAVRTINVKSVAWTVQAHKEEYLTGFFMESGHYPPVIFPEGIHPRIAYCIQNNKSFSDPSANTFGQIIMEDFAQVELTKTEEIDFLEDMLPYLKDTTSAIRRSNVYQCYISETAKKGRDKEVLKESKALLTYILCDEAELDHVTWCKDFGDRMNDLSDFLEDLVIKLVPKEKELKVMARLFGCMAYKLRCGSQVILRFMQRYLKKFSSSQAMVMSELELNRKLYAFSKARHMSKSIRAFIISVDAEAWNNAFTRETVEPVLRGTFDSVTGSSLISRIHDVYEGTLFYSFEKGNTLYYVGQNGGIEGLQQCNWMDVYTQQIKHALRTCQYKYFVIIKGDDVRVRFEIPIVGITAQNTEKMICESLKDTLAKGLAEFGHKIKKLESYFSESVFAFSKKIYICEVALPSSYRQIQKTYGANNAFMFSLDDLVGSAYSNAHSSSSYGLNPLAAISVAMFWSMLHILLYDRDRRVATRRSLAKGTQLFHKLSDHELTALLVTPSAFGGFPIIHLHNMFLRAESDLVSSFCGLAMFARKFNPQLHVVLRRLCNYRLEGSKPFSMLVSDPYCLPRYRYSSPNNTLQKFLKASISKNAVNPFVKALFSKEVDDWKRDFVAAVASGNRLDPKLINAIYDCSLPALQERFLQKFTSAKTVIEHIWSMGATRGQINAMCRTLMREEYDRQTDRLGAFTLQEGCRVGVDIRDFKCPAAAALALRNQGWEKEVDGITYPPAQHQTRLKKESEVRYADVSKLSVYEIIPSESFHPDMPAPHFAATGLDTFIGHRTPSGTLASPLNLDTGNQIVINIKKLLSISTMCLLMSIEDQPAGTFTWEDVCLHMISMYTQVPFAQLSNIICRHKSGTRTHHMAARGFEVAIVPNMIKNMMSHAKMNTDTDRQLRATNANYTINFLQLMSHNVTMLQFGWFLPDSPSAVGSYRSMIPPCPDCFREIVEPNTYMTDHSLFRMIANLPANLQHQLDIAAGTLEASLAEDDDNWTIRQVRLSEDESLESVWEVISEELFRQTINLYSRIATSFSIMRATVDRVQDMIHLSGRSAGMKSLTMSEVIKIPSSVLVRRLRLEIISRVYTYFPLEETSDLLVFYANTEPQTLPWASVLKQLGRGRKLQSIVAEICRIIGEPVSAHGNDMRDYGAVSRFAGRELSIRAFGPGSSETPRIRVQAHIPARDLHHRINATRLLLLRRLIAEYPLERCFPHQIEWEKEGFQLLVPILSILVLIFGPTHSVEDIGGKFKLVTVLETTLPLIAEVWPTWFEDGEKIQTRCSQETKALLDVWIKDTGVDVANIGRMEASVLHLLTSVDLHDTLASYSKELMIYCVVTFHDLPLCYKMLRSSLAIPELDDVSEHDRELKKIDINVASLADLSKRVPKEFEKMETFVGVRPERGVSVSKENPKVWDTGIKIDFTHLLRPFGTTTTAWVKTHKILKELGVLGKLRTLSFYAAILADGDGGDSRYILESFPMAFVVWNTLNPALGELLHQPPSLRVYDDDRGYLTVHPRAITTTQMLESGDLTQMYVQDLIIDQIPKEDNYQIVKHDADLPYGIERTKVARELWFGVLRIFTRKGSATAVMIQKVFLDIPETVSWLISLATSCCKIVRLVTIPESHCSYEAYVIAMNPTMPIDAMPLMFSSVLSVLSPTLKMSDHLAGIIDDCYKRVSSRETMVNVLPGSSHCPNGFCPKYKVSLAGLMIDDREAANPALLLRRLCHDTCRFKANQLLYESRVPIVGTTDATAQSLILRTMTLFKWMVVIHVIREILLQEGLGVQVRNVATWSEDIKKIILGKADEALQSLTTSGRWRGLGGPFGITNVPATTTSGAYPLLDPAISAFEGGIKGALEYIGFFLNQDLRDIPRIYHRIEDSYTKEERDRRRKHLVVENIPLMENMEGMDLPDVFVQGPEREERRDEDDPVDDYLDFMEEAFEEDDGEWSEYEEEDGDE